MGTLYAAYITGAAGISQALLYVGGGTIAGADAGGLHYDGRYETVNGSLVGSLDFIIPAGQQVITGASAGEQSAKFTTPINLPPDFDDGRVIRVETPVGPVNVRFEKIRELQP